MEGLERLLGNAQIVAIVCNQYGDTGKGKFSDVLAQEWADVVARGTGGANAGHTVFIEGKPHAFHLLPAGITYDSRGLVTILGNGMVIDPHALIEEIDEWTNLGGTHKNLMISEDANVVMRYHIAFDRAKNQSQKEGGIGSTGRGMGPAYTDKIARRGIVMRDLLDKDTLAQKIKNALPFYPEQEIDVGSIMAEMQPVAERLGPLLRNTAKEMHVMVRRGKRIVLEGAQGLLLSVEHGVPPYVTSSDCSVNGTASGVGISAKAVDLVLGICKFPLMTRVGGGPFPTELGGKKSEDYCAQTDSDGKPTHRREVELAACPYWRELMNSGDSFLQGIGMRIAAGEYGATTGRPRRVGWTDAVAARYAVGINGPMKLVLTKVDAVAGIKQFKIAYAYLIPSCAPATSFSRDAGLLRGCSADCRVYPGYGDIRKARTYGELPSGLRNAIRDFEKFAGSQVGVVSVGPEAHQTIIV